MIAHVHTTYIHTYMHIWYMCVCNIIYWITHMHTYIHNYIQKGISTYIQTYVQTYIHTSMYTYIFMYDLMLDVTWMQCEAQIEWDKGRMPRWHVGLLTRHVVADVAMSKWHPSLQIAIRSANKSPLSLEALWKCGLQYFISYYLLTSQRVCHQMIVLLQESWGCQ